MARQNWLPRPGRFQEGLLGDPGGHAQVLEAPPGLMRKEVEGLGRHPGPGDECVAGGQAAVPTVPPEDRLREGEAVRQPGRMPSPNPGTHGGREAEHPEDVLHMLGQPLVSNRTRVALTLQWSWEGRHEFCR